MGYQSTAIAYNTRQSVDSSTFSGSYLPIGSPISNSARIVKIINNSGVDVDISTDGVTNHDFIPKNGFTLYDLGTNRGNDSPCLNFSTGTQFYAKGSASTGLVYMISLYGQGNTQTPPL